jgi:hypothetical protein
VVHYTFRLVRHETGGARARQRFQHPSTGGAAIISTLVSVTERMRGRAARGKGFVPGTKSFSISEGVVLVDRDLRVITCNESMAV